MMERITREESPALLEHGVGQVVPDRAATVVATVVVCCSGPCGDHSKIAAAVFTRIGYAGVRVCAGGRQGRAEAGSSFEGGRVATPAAGAGRPA
ncbi:hypothetical protein [Nonomuraea diastatica]|uniref:Rhodanese domain-containing protein n=1 Tax=Nonomuraea diastatica TaxID=1848329 RepID=A0A4R4WKN4_9ACTN|nr:hypothetical protein [Nonomuraea diastatica]TDD19679.1 hypothetical protein E1294_20010 [Nonomuraea diastatica]